MESLTELKDGQTILVAATVTNAKKQEIRLIRKPFTENGRIAFDYDQVMKKLDKSESFTPKVGKEYEFSDDGRKWVVRKYGCYASIEESYEGTSFEGWKFIRPIQQSEEEKQFLELAEKFKHKYKLTNI